MKRSELAAVLAVISAIDNRRLDPPNADITNPLATPILSGWYDLVGDLRAVDCLEAIRNHRKATSEWLAPAHVIAGVEAIREERHRRGPTVAELTADVDPDDVLGHRRALQERTRMVGDGVRFQTELGARGGQGTVRIIDGGAA